MIEEFYAWTTSGALYRVYTGVDRAVVARANEPPGSTVPIGTVLGSPSYVGVTRDHGLVVYVPEVSGGRPLSAWNTNTKYWDKNTSLIIGLFSSFEDAKRGFNSQLSPLPWDWLYLSQTQGVLAQIAEGHPFIILDEPVRHMLEETGVKL